MTLTADRRHFRRLRRRFAAAADPVAAIDRQSVAIAPRSTVALDVAALVADVSDAPTTLFENRRHFQGADDLAAVVAPLGAPIDDAGALIDDVGAPVDTTSRPAHDAGAAADATARFPTTRHGIPRRGTVDDDVERPIDGAPGRSPNVGAIADDVAAPAVDTARPAAFCGAATDDAGACFCDAARVSATPHGFLRRRASFWDTATWFGDAGRTALRTAGVPLGVGGTRDDFALFASAWRPFSAAAAMKLSRSLWPLSQSPTPVGLAPNPLSAPFLVHLFPSRLPRRARGPLLVLGLVAYVAAPSGAQHSLPPVRQLGRRLAVGSDTLGAVSGIRQLSDGRVLINDVHRGRLLLYDSTLTHGVVVADSTPSTKSAYGSSSGGIIPYLGDTTLFVDGASLSVLVIAPDGAIGRVMSAPRPADIASLLLPIGGAAVDAQGRFIYRSTGVSVPRGQREATFIGASPRGGDSISTRDSSYIVRADPVTRRIDTLGFVTAPKNFVGHSTGVGPDGNPRYRTVVNPIQVYDGWAALADGSVAIVRGFNYRIDWINPDGTPGPPTDIAHEWHRLSDGEKTAIVDSVRRVIDSATAARKTVDSLTAIRNHQLPSPSVDVTDVVNAADLPDYLPPFAGHTQLDAFVPGAVVADRENNLWIRQGPAARSTVVVGRSTFTQSVTLVTPPIYDVVNRQGQLIDRIQIPPSLTLAGFGPGVVYLTSREGAGTVVVKYRIH